MAFFGPDVVLDEPAYVHDSAALYGKVRIGRNASIWMNVVARAEQKEIIVVQTSYGVGKSQHRLPLATKLMFALLLKPQIADTKIQESVVRESGLDWVIAQPVHLTDGLEQGSALSSPVGEVRQMKISLRQVARFLADAAGGHAHVGRSVALSTA